MDGYLVGLGAALWLGVLTSISPCPMATNIAAISYIGKRTESPRQVLLSGLLYTAGRTLTYVAVAMIVLTSLFSIPAVANFLQDNINRVLGPILLIAGLLLFELIPWPWSGRGVSDKLQRRVNRAGIWGAGLLGILFALSFCPISAALFFGSLIPLAVQHQSSIMMPSLYGIGTALPVVCFAFILAFGAQRLGKAFNLLTAIEGWMRRATAMVFLGVGGYYTLAYTFGII